MDDAVLLPSFKEKTLPCWRNQLLVLEGGKKAKLCPAAVLFPALQHCHLLHTSAPNCTPPIIIACKVVPSCNRFPTNTAPNCTPLAYHTLQHGLEILLLFFLGVSSTLSLCVCVVLSWQLCCICFKPDQQFVLWYRDCNLQKYGVCVCVSFVFALLMFSKFLPNIPS